MAVYVLPGSSLSGPNGCACGPRVLELAESKARQSERKHATADASSRAHLSPGLHSCMYVERADGSGVRSGREVHVA